MMHLIEFMKTPLAAPETPGLKAMRFTILGCCCLLLPAMVLIGALRALFGSVVVGIVFGLLATLALLVPIYVSAKNKADDAHLDTLLAVQRTSE